MNPAATAPLADVCDDSEAMLRLADRLAAWPLTFPTSARIALSVVEAINAPDCSLESIVRPVQADPLLATKVVSLANSAAYDTSGRGFTMVREAVQRIGLSTLKSLAVSMVMKQMAVGAATGRGEAAFQLWEHSAHVAALAHVIARRLTGQSAEAAMFAGIVHELSGFYLLSIPREQLDIDDSELARWMTGGSSRDPYEDDDGAEPPAARIGRPLLRAMQVPEPIIEAVSVTWRGYLAMPPESLGDALALADALAPIPSPFDNGLNCGAGAAICRPEIDLVVGGDTLAQLLDESGEIIRTLLGALRF